MDQLETTKKTWEAPKLVIHGDVVQITQVDKTWGMGDGFTFQGESIRNAS